MYSDSKKRAFTLVELLVVISIIALLLAIMMPALQTARNQARVVVCAANAKQIGTVASVYQGENSGCVPVVMNRFCSDVLPARNCYLSVAFRDYDPQTKGKLNATPYDCSKPWQHQGVVYRKYCTQYLPSYYKCPFNRGKPAGTMNSVGVRTIKGAKVELWDTQGAQDSYSTFMWAYKAGPQLEVLNYGPMPNWTYSQGGVFPKFGAQVWHTYYKQGNSGGNPRDSFVLPGRPVTNWDSSIPMRWESSDFKAVGGGASSVTIAICDIGEWSTASVVGAQYATYNLGSHRRSGRGGSNAIFADGHIEWVLGSQIGWQ
jgi:prepilin-type N-terminal cleavage/methylation domain-containing protein/prepilin-type processing-associated H-X9-DG protein